MEHRQEENDAIDGLLRRSMAGPVPSLPPNFEQRILRAVRRASEPLDGYHKKLLAGYGLVSAVVSAVVMRGQGLPWGAAAASILAPLILIGIGRSVWRATHATASHHAG